MTDFCNCSCWKAAARTVVLAVLVAILLTGCTWHGSSGSLHVRSLGDQPVALYSRFTASCFSQTAAETSFMLSDGPVEDLLQGKLATGQILHLQLLWEPKAGRTPIDSSATNASIRYVVISQGEVGIYSGAGFAFPRGSLNGDRVTIDISNASLQLQEATAGFVDLLSPAELTGSFSSQRDERREQQMNRAASQLVTNALGRTRYVRDDRPESDGMDQPLMSVILTRR